MKAPVFGLEAEGCTEIKDETIEGGNVNIDGTGEEIDGPALDIELSAAKEEDAPQEEAAEKEEEYVEEFEEGHPLYGLEKRMRLAKIDDEMKAVLKQKLIDQHAKTLTQLDERQK